MGRAQLYILREVVFLFGTILAVFTFLLTLEQLVELTELVLEGVPAATIGHLLAFLTPSVLIFTLPLAFLTATAMAFSRLSLDGEIVALKTAGASLSRLLVPVLLMAALLFLLMSGLTLWARPKGSDLVRHSLLRIVASQVHLNLEPQVFIRAFDDLVLYFEEIDREALRLQGILIADLREPKVKQTIFAREGWLASDADTARVTLYLKDGSIHRTRASGPDYQFLTFSENRFSLEVGETLRHSTARLARDRFQSLQEIRTSLTAFDTADTQRIPLLLQLHKMFSLPAASFLVGLIGVPLGISNRRSGKSGGFILSVGVALLYYIVALGGEGMAEDGRLAPWIAVWTPVGFLGGLAAYLVVKVQRESPVLLFEALERLQELLQRLRKVLPWAPPHSRAEGRSGP